DVLEVTEAVMHAVFETTGFSLAAPPWPRLSYAEALSRFGSDRPDRRFGLELADVSDRLRGSEFRVFESVIGGGGGVRALNAGARERFRPGLEGLHRRRPPPRRQGRRLRVRRERRLALADREVLLGRPAVRRRPGAQRVRG